MIKIDKELDTMEENVLKMGQKVVRMHEKVVQALNSPIRKSSWKSYSRMILAIIWRRKSTIRQYALWRCCPRLPVIFARWWLTSKSLPSWSVSAIMQKTFPFF